MAGVAGVAGVAGASFSDTGLNQPKIGRCPLPELESLSTGKIEKEHGPCSLIPVKIRVNFNSVMLLV